ncbi:MAG: histidinol-phosphatase HisJ family protein [Bacteroidales bacterium]|nr:histidinol-phosphatase HisJ family protein [Bacteroidales bacterium]
MYFDTHNHSQFSFDGKATTVEKSVKAAVDAGLGGICFTDHCDFYVPEMKGQFEPRVSEVFDVQAQQAEVDRVAAMVADGAFGRAVAKKFKVLKGIEVGLEDHSRELNKNLLAAQSFDQVTVSVHYLEDTDPYYGPYYKGKNWKEAYGRYLETLLREMKRLGDFDIMGHFDYIARYAPYPKESILYRDFPGLMDEILKYLAENGKGLEINTKTYKPYGLRTPQLDRDILMRFMELGGEVICLGSDSHKPEQVGLKFDYFAQYVKMFGFRRLGHFEGRRLKMVTI